MEINKYEAVFTTGLVRNNTTRLVLPNIIIEQYTLYCKRLLLEKKEMDLFTLYIIASRALEAILDDPELNISLLSVVL